jgi:hypothetical protein
MSISGTGVSQDEPLVVSPRRARRLLDCGNTRLYELLAACELDSFLDGRSRKITVESIHRYISRRLTPGGSPAGTTTQPHGRGRLRKNVSRVASAQ